MGRVAARNQSELQFDGNGNERKPWERRLHEPSRSYAAFLIFRNLGPGRSLLEAYRTWKRERDGQPEGRAPLITGVARPIEDDTELETSAANNWRTWRLKWDWDQRAEAWDDWREETRSAREQAEETEAYEQRRERRKILDELHFNRIMKLNSIIDNAITEKTVGQTKVEGLDLLAKTRQEIVTDDRGSKRIRELDATKAFEVVAAEAADLEKRYFRGIGESLDQPNAAPPEEVSKNGAPQFVWMPDPEIVEAAQLMIKASETVQQGDSE